MKKNLTTAFHVVLMIACIAVAAPGYVIGFIVQNIVSGVQRGWETSRNYRPRV